MKRAHISLTTKLASTLLALRDDDGDPLYHVLDNLHNVGDVDHSDGRKLPIHDALERGDVSGTYARGSIVDGREACELPGAE